MSATNKDATAIGGSVYGQGSGPMFVVCPQQFSSFVDFTPVGSCSTSPGNVSCSHERDVGLRCSPGQCKSEEVAFLQCTSICA